MLSCLFLASCFKDECQSVRTLYEPVYKTLTQVRQGMVASTPESLVNTGKIYVYGNYIFLSEVNKGIHIIDNSDPSNPVNLSFVNIPGNQDLAVNGHYLYADSYSDLVVFDISDAAHAHAVKFLNNVFTDRNYFYYGSGTNPDSLLVPVAYVAKDTLISCTAYSNLQYTYSNYYPPALSSSGGQVFLTADPAAKNDNANGGKGGSMARFALLDNYLYTVSYSSITSFNIADAASPEVKTTSNIDNWMIETIYPFKDKLFIGSQNGMFVYSVADPANPSQLGMATHVRTCDPVIADDNYAYVTLRSGTLCSGYTNQLDIMSLDNIINPVILISYQMTNPRGLSKDGNNLFICDENVLKLYDASDINNLKLEAQEAIPETFDVITNNSIALVVAKDGLYQFDYSDIHNMRQLSKISIQ